ncbi:PAS domain-containing protein [Tabrizicola sp.]|uniref:PAS domain-containing protein n=1 Tax=Tabrizicola sp. TaxID=2005166 RepID=UPI002737731A|nr:PAS domain-containing protein [Tabrizicola sp.]MDP3195768.1 PAS domain-containing protein [Tabrizicola sp.]
MGHAGQPDTGTAQPARVELRVVELMNRLLDVTPDTIESEIDAVLAALGEGYGFARTFLFRYAAETGYRNTHEWVAPGVQPLKPVMQGGPQVVRPAWHQAFQDGRIVAVLDRSELPDGSPEHQFLTDIGVSSSLMVPLCDGNRLFGVIGFDCCRPDRHWHDEAVFLLTSIGRAVSSIVLRVEAARAEAALRSHLAATLNALPDLVIELAPTGEIVACQSDKLPWLSSLVRAGIGRHVAQVLPLPLAQVMTEILAAPPGNTSSLTRRVGVSTLVTPHRYEVSVARLSPSPPGLAANLIVVIRDIATSDRSSEMTSFREGQFTAFFEMCPHPILVNDFDTGEIVDVNRAFKDMFGLDPQAGINLQVQQILPQDGAWLIEGARAALKAAQTYGPVEATFRCKTGRSFPAVVRCFMSVDPNGRRLVWSLIENITEIRAKEAALQAGRNALEATKSRFLAAIEALDDGFAIFDAQDRLVLWNTPYVRVFSRIGDLIREGALYDDLLRAAISRGVFGAEGERDSANLQRRLDRPLTEVWDNEDELADGRLIWVRERATPSRETVGLYEDVTARRLADRRLEQVVDGGGIAVWDWASDHGFTTINDCWETMLGLGSARALADLIELVHPEDRLAVAEAQRELFLSGSETFSLRCRMRHQSGKWVWLLTRGHVAARWADGSPRRISGITLDVSVQTEAEQRLAHVIDGTQVGTWEHDMRTGITVVSDRWAEILGFRAVELNPMSLQRWLDMLHPDDTESLISHERDAFESGQWQVEHEVRLRHRDGHWVWVLTRAQVSEWDEGGCPVKTSGINLDISAAKSLEFALARERDTLARVMEASVSGIVVVDERGAVVFANAAAERVLGRKVSAGSCLLSLLGDDAVTDLDGNRIPTDQLPVARALSGEPGMHEVRHDLHWPSGERRVVAVTSARLSAAGTEAAVVCTFTDITDEVQSQDRLRAAMTAAETANRAKSDFLAAMSHEIRTPLNGVLGMATVLASRLTDPQEQAMVRVIRDSGEHLLGVINDILDLAKIEAGRLVLDPRPIRLPDILMRVAALHQITATEKGVQLIIHCSGGAGREVRLGDEMRLIQILHNLMGNALKFTDTGHVRVEIDCSDPEAITIHVQDTGIGMSAEEISRAFDEFTQGMGGSRRSHVGTGLGLPIVRRLTRLMHGDVSLQSVEGQGVTARVLLKIPVLVDGAAHASGAEVPHLPPLRVLAAEDNATNRIILQSMLQSLGVATVIVADGSQALHRFRDGGFDAVLLDIAMPGMDGLDTLQALNVLAAELGRPAPRAIAVTANVMTHQVDDYLGNGFAAVVAKPIRIERLSQALWQCVDQPADS